MSEVTADLLLQAYMSGVFPMAETRDSDELFWVDPDMRGIIPLNAFHIPKSLLKVLKKEPFEIRIDHNFEGVIKACAEPRPGHKESWINATIIDLYQQLFDRGFVHTVECWHNNQLCGGLYGVSIGGAFFGESMFHRKTDASKIALCYLVARLKYGGYQLLDTQFITDHLEKFGTIEIPREQYQQRLDSAIYQDADFYSLPVGVSSDSVVQLITQIS